MLQRDQTNTTAETRLRQLPRLHLSAQRSNEIRRALEESETAAKQHRRFLRPALWVATAAVVLIGSGLFIPYPGSSQSILAHWSAAAHQRLGPHVSDNWLTESQQRDLAIKAVASLYQTQSYTVIRMESTKTEATHQPMYVVELKGHFQEGTGPQSRKVTATYLSFSILADGTKAWAITAGNGDGKDAWSVSGPLAIKAQQLIYRGHSQDWTAVYRQARVYVWHKNSLDNQDDLGMAIQHDGQLRYTGPTLPNRGGFQWSIDGAGDTSGGSMSFRPRGPIEIKMPNLQLPDQSSSIQVSATIGGHSESFTMYDITQASNR